MAAGFIGGSAAWVYLIPSSSTGIAVLELAAFGLFHVVCGAAIARWWAPLLPALVTLTVIPSDRDHDVPQWFDYLLFAAAPAALVLALGVVLGRRREHHGRLPRALPRRVADA